MSEPARVRITLKRGRRVVRSFTVDGRAGLNRVRGGHHAHGRYRLTARPVDAAGNAGRARITRFARRAAGSRGR